MCNPGSSAGTQESEDPADPGSAGPEDPSNPEASALSDSDVEPAMMKVPLDAAVVAVTPFVGLAPKIAPATAGGPLGALTAALGMTPSQTPTALTIVLTAVLEAPIIRCRCRHYTKITRLQWISPHLVW